ncbi:MAG: response regulator [Candidatus Omnitrophica bacterium]|nr:response regulator [Candidatus Omnitrophota bacterium]MDD5487852.1 response regulator [Candidatus Omnitrophota bacterium]
MGFRKKILVVDDEPDLQEIMRVRLQSAGYEVVMSSDGQAGLNMMRSERPDLVILDIMMPGMDGYEFFKKARTDPRVSDIPIIMLTARSGMKSCFEALNAEGFFSKPVDFNRLSDKIKHELQDRAVILSSDDTVEESVRKAFLSSGYTCETAKSEEDLFERAKKEKFKVLAVHLADISISPSEFAERIKTLKCAKPFVVVYSDQSVKGVEDNDMVKIDTLRIKWKKNGLPNFYDRRLAGQEFAQAARSWLR